ncbi:MAG: peptidoglycan editing factor PgeF [Anaerolineae bacterium]
MERHEQNGLVYYRFDLLGALKHGVFTRHGGTSAAPFASLNLGGNVGDDPKAVRQNHVRMYEVLGVEDTRACTVWQVHSVDTVLVNQPVKGRRWIAAADGMITDKPDTPLSMRFADCTPILLYDPVQGVIGMAHAGWRGTVKGMSAHIVKAMTQAYGCKPANIRAVIGPSIGPNRYQVGAEVVDAARAYFGDVTGLFHIDPRDNTPYFNLWEANRRDLERGGVEQIEIAGICTAEHTGDFFSHRAEHGQTGRFGAVLSMS